METVAQTISGFRKEDSTERIVELLRARCKERNLQIVTEHSHSGNGARCFIMRFADAKQASAMVSLLSRFHAFLFGFYTVVFRLEE